MKIIFSLSISTPQEYIYKIADFCQQGTTVQGYCDTLTDGGGWLVIQRRKDGSEDFDRFWWDYKTGFGSLTGEFWFGLDALHCVTSQGEWELRIDLKLTNGTRVYLSYEKFAVGPASEQYPLTISGFTGYTSDPLNLHLTPTSNNRVPNTMKFTTRDQDNDRCHVNCAATPDKHGGITGGWWNNCCANIFPNNQYNHRLGVVLNNQWLSLLFIELKIRPKNCT